MSLGISVGASSSPLPVQCKPGFPMKYSEQRQTFGQSARTQKEALSYGGLDMAIFSDLLEIWF